VANTLISEAVAEGWLGPPAAKANTTFTFAGQRPQLRAAAGFYNALAKEKAAELPAATVQRQAKDAARGLVPNLQATLEASGFVRDAQTRWTLRLLVFLGAASALVVTSAIAVLVGDGLARLVPEVWVRRLAGVGFLVMGVLFLLGKE